MFHQKKSVLKFLLQSWENGKLFDNVTPNKLPYLLLIPEQGGWKFNEPQRIQTLFHQHNITFAYLTNQGGFSLAVDVLMTVTRILEEAQYVIVEKIPYFVFQRVVEAQDIPVPSLQNLQDNIGPTIWTKLRPFQKVAVQFAVSRKKVYIADEMGSGKTFEALATCKYFAQQYWPVLVVCPGSLRFNWQAEVHKWLEVPMEEILVLKAAKEIVKMETTEHKFLIASYALVHKPTVKVAIAKKYKTIVLDEAHYVKSRTSKRSETCMHLLKHAKIRIMLSGTPFNYPSEMYQQIKMMYPHIYPYFFHFNSNGYEESGRPQFALRYCQPTRTMFRQQCQWHFKGYKRHHEFNAVLNTFMIRRRKHDILTQLPKKNRICITLDPFTPSESKQIAKLLKAATKTKTKKKKSVQIQLSTADKYMKSFRKTCQFKKPKVVKFVKEVILNNVMQSDEKMQIILFMHHESMKEALETLLQQHEMSYFVINGETPALKRQEYADAFQTTHKYRVALLSVMAAGTGLTLTAARTVVFTEILFGPEQHLQAEDRVHRLGQKHQVNIFYLKSPNSTDDINFGLIRKKERESSLMLDGKANILKSQFVSAQEDNISTMFLHEKKTKSKSKSLKRKQSSLPHHNNYYVSRKRLKQRQPK